MSTPPLGSPASPAAADAKAGRRKLAIVIVVFVVVMPCLVLTGTVGLLIYFGQRQQASRSEAEKLELTCRFADKWTTSCHKLGLHYLNGTGGVTRDAAKAAERFRKSCDLGYQGSCSSLGYLLARGRRRRAGRRPCRCALRAGLREGRKDSVCQPWTTLDRRAGCSKRGSS